MYSYLTIIAIVIAYIGILLLVALWGEKKSSLGYKWASSPTTYALSMAVLCTTWTYYGSVGSAVSRGMGYLSVYIGPTLICLLFWPILIKIIRLKNQYHFTNIADFIAARYGNSHVLGTVITVLLLLGLLPYVALQFKAIVTTAWLLTDTDDKTLHHAIGIVFLIMIIAFTILFGARRLDPTERHQGMMLALALESILKLVFLVMVGLLVCYGFFDGVSDILNKAEEVMKTNDTLAKMAAPPNPTSWFSVVIVSAFAFLLLPRQFHVMVVENSNEDHVRVAQWMLPLYLLLINVLMVPIAAGGLLLGLSPDDADSFVLMIPMMSEIPDLSILVFIGGFSAGIGMIIVAAMSMSTMASNHILLPILERSRSLSFLRRYLLACRWAIITLFLVSGYLIFIALTKANISLAYIGITSFVAILQLAPAVILGLFWRQGNKAGAIIGMLLGYGMWMYSLVLPSLVKINVLNDSFINGIGGFELLSPVGFLGLELDLISHSIFWSLTLNLVGYVLGSLFFRAKRFEFNIASSFVSASVDQELDGDIAYQKKIRMDQKYVIALKLFRDYFPESEAQKKLNICIGRSRIDNKSLIDIMELIRLKKEIDRSLSGVIGTASANTAIQRSGLINRTEARELDEAYSVMIKNLQISPEELREKISFYQEKERLIEENNQALKQSLDKLEHEVEIRKQTEHSLINSEEKLKKLNQELEDRVNERTAELQEAYESLKDTLSKLQKTQDQLVEAEKMASMGSLVAGVAHEINTPLGVGITACSLLKEQIDGFEEQYLNGTLSKNSFEKGMEDFKEAIALIESPLEKTAELVKSFKQVAVDGSRNNFREVDVTQLLVELTSFQPKEVLNTTINYSVQSPDKIFISTNPTAINQVFKILFENSWVHGFKDRNEGEIWIKISPHKDGVKLVYEDNGVGFEEADIPRLFDPFFTTKRSSGSVGLGLHVLFNQVTQNLKGSVIPSNRDEGGSRFEINLPYGEELNSHL